MKSEDTGQIRVLIVDDDHDACEILTQVLKHIGHHAVCVQDSVEALSLLLHDRFDIVLTDLVMPGLSGFDLLRASRVGSNQPRAVIAVSSYSEFRQKAQEVGFTAFIDKPVELSKLRPVLAGLLLQP